MLDVTVTEAEDVQPVREFVIRSVYVPEASTVGVRVFWPDTKLPPTVVHRKTWFESEEEAEALSTVCGKEQFNCGGCPMSVIGAGDWFTETLAVAGQIVALLTVTV